MPLPAMRQPKASLYVHDAHVHVHVHVQEMQQRFQDIVTNIQNCQGLLVNGELANWKQSQRLFNWEDDRGKVELNTMQQL